MEENKIIFEYLVRRFRGDFSMNIHEEVEIENKKSVIETAKRLLYLRRCAMNDRKSYERQLEEISEDYGLDIDYENDKVKFKK